MSNQSRIGNNLWLSRNAVRVHAGAYAEVGQSLAGRNRWLREHATGASAVSGETPVAPLNPQGELGADLSGPPFGAALKHMVAWWLGDSSPASARGPKPAWAAVGGVEATELWSVWVRPHAEREDGQAPYQRLRFCWRSLQSAATPTTWAIRVRNNTLGGREVSTTREISTTADTGWTEMLVPMQAGRNDLVVGFRRVTANSVTLNVATVGLALPVKRRHGIG